MRQGVPERRLDATALLEELPSRVRCRGRWGRFFLGGLFLGRRVGVRLRRRCGLRWRRGVRRRLWLGLGLRRGPRRYRASRRRNVQGRRLRCWRRRRLRRRIHRRRRVRGRHRSACDRVRRQWCGCGTDGVRIECSERRRRIGVRAGGWRQHFARSVDRRGHARGRAFLNGFITLLCAAPVIVAPARHPHHRNENQRVHQLSFHGRPCLAEWQGECHFAPGADFAM